jgi:hypothetical protein
MLVSDPNPLKLKALNPDLTLGILFYNTNARDCAIYPV